MSKAKLAFVHYYAEKTGFLLSEKREIDRSWMVKSETFVEP
jgi:hypothetical protein